LLLFIRLPLSREIQGNPVWDIVPTPGGIA
jgi:hypothetical protein